MWIIDAKKANGTYEILIKFNDGKNTVVDLKNTIENDRNRLIKNQKSKIAQC